jgi:SAM-dependent methyltransferase
MPIETILDIACGTGRTFKAVVDTIHYRGQAILMDKSSAMISIAKSNVDYEKTSFVECDIGELNKYMGEGKIDVCLCNSAIWNMDFSSVLRELSHVIRPGGRFGFTLPTGVVFRTFDKSVRDLLADNRSENKNHTEGAHFPVWRSSFVQENISILNKFNFKIEQVYDFEIRIPINQILSFWRIPVMTETMFPQLSYEERLGLLEDVSKSMKVSDYEIFNWQVCILIKI